MKNKYTNRSNLLLLEIIIALLFFSVSSGVCIQIFIKSHTISDNSKTLDFAVTQSASLGEILTEGGDAYTAMSMYYQTPEIQDGSYLFYFDENYKICKMEDYCYRIVVKPETDKDGLPAYTITTNHQQSLSPLYVLTVISYQPATR